MVLCISLFAFESKVSEEIWSLGKVAYIDFFVKDVELEVVSLIFGLLVLVVFGITLSHMGLCQFWFCRCS